MDELKEPEKQQTAPDVKSSPEKIPDIKDRMTNRKIRWDIVSVVVTTAYVFVSLLMYLNMNQQITLTKESLSKTNSSLQLTKQSLDKTDKQLEQMSRSNDIQDSNISIQKKYFNLQSDYYRQTIRPFLYVILDSIKLQVDNPKDTILTCSYYIKNIGQLPAKQVNTSMIFDSFENRTLLFEFIDRNKGVAGVIYPNELLRQESRNKNITLREVINKPFLHIMIGYQDVNGKYYRSKRILKVSLNVIKGENSMNMVWSDFD
jgi:hypothetical protein